MKKETMKGPEQVGQVVSMLAAGMSTRQIAREMGAGWSQTSVVAFKNKADVKETVEQVSRALLARSFFQAVDNQAMKIKAAGDQLQCAVEAMDRGDEEDARKILKEAYGILKLSDQAEARMLEMVGMAPTHGSAPVYNYINAPVNQAIISPEVIELLGQAQGSNLGKLMGGEDFGPGVAEVLEAKINS